MQPCSTPWAGPYTGDDKPDKVRGPGALGGPGRAQRGPKKGPQDPEEIRKKKQQKDNRKEKKEENKKDSVTGIYVSDEWIC
jgi:hypothetical protein